jgi:DNA topoisomerase-1
MNLVLVETPAQARRVRDALGDGWRVEPCYGSVRDLPINQLGIDVDNDFRPTFTVRVGKGNLVRRLMKALRECDAVYVATPSTREGEAMAYHLLALSRDTKDKPVYRVTFSALTPESIRAALADSRPLDLPQIEAHVAERTVDRLMGWGVNAAARQALGFQTQLSSAGLLALRLLADRAGRMANFTPTTQWHATVTFTAADLPFTALVLNPEGRPLPLQTDRQVAQLEALLKRGYYWVNQTGQALKTLPAPTPLTLPRLIEHATRTLHLPPKRALHLVNTLYDAGWITTPDAAVSPALQAAAETYIRREFGTEYLRNERPPATGFMPTDVSRQPEGLPGDGAAIYALIWQHFITAHMAAAQTKLLGATLLVGKAPGQPYPLELRTLAALRYFEGWQRLLPTDFSDSVLPILTRGQLLRPEQVTIEQLSSPPQTSYDEVELVGTLIACGLPIQQAVEAVDQLRAASYIAGETALSLTEVGQTLANYLVANFGELVAPAFAREWTAELARVASGERQRVDALRAFWQRFGGLLRSTPSIPTVVVQHKPVVLRPVEEV